MSVDFRKIIEELRSLVDALKVRCSIAEKRVEESDSEIEVLKARNSELEEQLSELSSKYESLKMGMATADNGDLSSLKDKYLALVREIDDCIRLMQHGR